MNSTTPQTYSEQFVARGDELARLSQLLETALAGELSVCFVTGEAGSGKTALLAEFASRAAEADPDLVFAIGDCNAQAGAGDPFLPFRELLGMLTGDFNGKLAEGAIDLPPRVVPLVKLVWPQPSGPALALAARVA